MSLIMEWTAIHQAELNENWDRMRRDELPLPIKPLDWEKNMSPRVTCLAHAGEYRLELIFEDGLKSVVDFKSRIMGRGGVCSLLHDVAYCKQAKIDPDLQTIVWPNGADICPDVLYSLAAGRPLPDAHAEAASI